MALIECVPNVSEGRRRDVIDAIADAVRRTNGARLLDYSSDVSHNRSVFTIAGDATGVEQAVTAIYDRAVAAIDLRTQRGVHPRIGAVDVVPFVPIDGITMAECAALARRTGAAIAERFQIPVYLYEEAASNPTRKNLEDIRRGEFEGLAAKMASEGWAPDFGPAVPHPTAGVSVVGARMPLIAYNINLATDRLDVAKKIAAAIRHSSGGYQLRESDGGAAREPRHRPGVDEPDELRKNTDRPGLRGRQARGGAIPACIFSRAKSWGWFRLPPSRPRTRPICRSRTSAAARSSRTG